MSCQWWINTQKPDWNVFEQSRYLQYQKHKNKYFCPIAVVPVRNRTLSAWVWAWFFWGNRICQRSAPTNTTGHCSTSVLLYWQTYHKSTNAAHQATCNTRVLEQSIIVKLYCVPVSQIDRRCALVDLQHVYCTTGQWSVIVVLYCPHTSQIDRRCTSVDLRHMCYCMYRPTALADANDRFIVTLPSACASAQALSYTRAAKIALFRSW